MDVQLAVPATAMQPAGPTWSISGSCACTHSRVGCTKSHSTSPRANTRSRMKSGRT